MNDLFVDGARLQAELAQLATFTELAARTLTGLVAAGDTAVTRVVFTPRDLEARAYLRSLAEAAGLAVRVDAVGNTFFRWAGSAPELPAIATGSHVDAIPNAGMYDGTVGVLGGLEAIRALEAAGYKPRRSIELILFTSEEPTRFGIGCLGSRLMSGALGAEVADALEDKAGVTLGEARVAAGFAGPLAPVLLKGDEYAGFVELHIEQGPELERLGLSIGIGIVTAIAAPASARIMVEGEGGHAGAMLMPVRHDALAAAAELVLAVERAALATGSDDTVATVGMCDVFPGAVNSVPSRATLSLDVRDIDGERRDAVLEAIFAAAREIGGKRGVRIGFEMLNADAPAACDTGIVAAIGEAAAGFGSLRMVSRAYHDALFMARLCPVGMIFIPCRGGVSHRPDEYSAPEQIAAGTLVLARTLATLST